MGVWAMEQLQAAEVNEPVPGEARASFDRNHLVRVEEPDDDFISQINAAEPNFKLFKAICMLRQTWVIKTKTLLMQHQSTPI